MSIEDCVVYDTLVQNFGDWTLSTSTLDYSGCHFARNARNMWCLDSVFHHLQGGGVGTSRSNGLENQNAPQRSFIGRNVVHHTKEYPILLKAGRDTIVSQNKVYRTRKSDSSRGAGVGVANQDHCNTNGCATHEEDWYADNLWIIFNEMYDAQMGVFAHQFIRCTTSGDCDETVVRART